jgi:hypothetical protein
LISRWEGLPRSILEGMRAGLPVLATDVAGVSEAVVDGETGFLVARGDVDEVERRLSQLLSDPALRERMGRAGRRRYEQQFASRFFIDNTLAVYERLLSGNDHRRGANRSAAGGARIPVLFIMGVGRSGSTVLDSILGNHPDVVGLGELRNLPGAGWDRQEYCACRERVTDCAFWSEVRRRWVELTGDASAESLRAAQRRVERTSNWFGLTGRRPGPEAEFQSYARLTGALLEAIRQTSGAKVLVDSSKHPLRALALSRVDGVDLRAVHLVRDGRGVAASLLRPIAPDPEGGVARALPARPAFRTATRWLLINWLAERTARRLGSARVRRVRYEDLMANPVQTLDAIGELLGIDLSSVAAAAAAGEPLTIGHEVAGNRLRMAGNLTLRRHDGWRDELGRRDELVVRLVAGRMLRRYGYSDRGHR